MTYAYLIVADHEMVAVEPGWRLLAIDTLTGAAYEMVGGFSSLQLAVTCRAGFLKQDVTPDEALADFQRLSADAIVVHDTPAANLPDRRNIDPPSAGRAPTAHDSVPVDRVVSFSMLLPLPSDKVRAALTLFHDVAAEAPVGMAGFDASASLAPPGLVLGSDDGDLDRLIAFIGRCAIRLHLTGRFGFSWSRACSDLRPGGFDGGAVVIDLGTGDVLDEIRTEEWIATRIGPTPSLTTPVSPS